MSKTKSWKRYLNEYFSENFVFAVRYLSMREINKFEKSWWILWIGASLGACIYSMVTTYAKWNSNPVVILYASELMPVSTVPFPAITICPLTKSRVEVFNWTWAFEMTDKNLTMDEDSEMKLRILAHVCPFASYWKTFNTSREENVVPALRVMAHSLEKIMVQCWWRSSMVPCGSIMIERLEDDGICYTFNSLALDEIYRKDQISLDFLNFSNEVPPSDWTRERGYRHGAGLNAYPNRPLTSGHISGLTLVAMIRKIDQEFMCRGPYTGYKLSVHAPDETALIEDRFYRLNTLNAAMLTVNPELINTSEELRNLSPIKRGCYFSKERYLRFFKSYSQINCAIECVANYTLEKCGCVKFSMPRAAGTKVCDASKIDCYQNAFPKMYKYAIRKILAGGALRTCYCIPACTSIDYQVEMSQIPFELNKFPIKLSFTSENTDPAAILVVFKERHYIPLLRRELMGVNQAIAELGGLFALLMGFSMMSLAEILYYCCVRSMRRERNRAHPRVKHPRSRGHRIHLRVDPWAKHRHQTLGLYNNNNFI